MIWGNRIYFTGLVIYNAKTKQYFRAKHMILSIAFESINNMQINHQKRRMNKQKMKLPFKILIFPLQHNLHKSSEDEKV